MPFDAYEPVDAPLATLNTPFKPPFDEHVDENKMVDNAIDIMSRFLFMINTSVVLTIRNGYFSVFVGKLQIFFGFG